MIQTDDRSKASQSAGPFDTKRRILDAAERLFGDDGVGATSLRSVIAAAGVNLAAIHYHFGSKKELLKAVVARRVGPVNRKRIELLDRYEQAPDGPTVEQLVQAFLQPMMDLWYAEAPGPPVTKLLGRLLGEPEFLRDIAPEQFQEVRDRFVSAFRRALPELPPDELFWRLMFVVGASTHTLRVADHLPQLSGGLCENTDAETAARRMTAFLVAGLQAKPTGGEE